MTRHLEYFMGLISENGMNIEGWSDDLGIDLNATITKYSV